MGGVEQVVRGCVETLINTHFENMLFVRFEQEMPYCRRLQDAIDARMEVAEDDPRLQRWFFDKPYMNLYLVHGGTHRTKALKIEVCQRTAVHNPMFVEWHNLKMFAVPP